MHSKEVLVVIDFINDIVNENAKSPSCAVHAKEMKAVAHANIAIDFARARSIPLIFVKVGFSHNYSELPTRSPVFKKAPEMNLFHLGEWGTEFVHELHVQKTDTVIVKHCISPFYQTFLETMIRDLEKETVVLAGVSTEWAIQAAARDAHDRNFYVTVLEDACAASNTKAHQTSIDTLSRIAKITTAEEWTQTA